MLHTPKAPTLPVGLFRPRMASLPLDGIINRSLLPQLAHFCSRLLAERKAMQLDGEPVFSGKDKFLPGKIAKGMSYLLLSQPADSPALARLLAEFAEIADLTLDDANDSWGIYYYLSALNSLREAGLLARAVSPATLARLAQQLDWRHFVDATSYRLQNLPTNYYGVAFSIARLRFLLGWEDASASEVLLEKTIGHYRTYSGEYGFSDETEGEGRFDRYSVLLVAEICQRFIETGLPVTAQLKAWLRRAADLVLLHLNPAGCGFDFGRSIGAYGDTAFVEILTTAARLDLLSQHERDLAYSFCVAATARYAEFWFDAGTHSVNLWDQGRRTDAYRGKHRILGENLSLLHQLIYTARQWAELGYQGQRPLADFAVALHALPRFNTTWFARGNHDRALITFRDGLRVISLPIISGGRDLHSHNPYYPIPFASGLVQGAADSNWPQLLPRITLADGSVLIPAAFQRELHVEQLGERLCVRYRQDAMDRLGGTSPQPDARIAVETTYLLEAGRIRREDRFIPHQPLPGAQISLEFASFSRDASLQADRVQFADGAASQFQTEGFDALSVVPVSNESAYRTPIGQLHNCVRATVTPASLGEPFCLAWTLSYR